MVKNRTNSWKKLSFKPITLWWFLWYLWFFGFNNHLSRPTITEHRTPLRYFFKFFIEPSQTLLISSYIWSNHRYIWKNEEGCNRSYNGQFSKLLVLHHNRIKHITLLIVMVILHDIFFGYNLTEFLIWKITQIKARIEDKQNGCIIFSALWNRDT